MAASPLRGRKQREAVRLSAFIQMRNSYWVRRSRADVGNPSLIWCDPVNIFESLGGFCICLFEDRVSSSRGR